MTTYYISPSGNNANNGLSTLAPKATFAHCVTLLNAGDTLLMMDGTYTESRLQLNNLNGTSANPITITNNPGDTVILSGLNIPHIQWIGFVDIIGSSYLEFSGFEIRDIPIFSVDGSNNWSSLGKNRGIRVWQSNNISIKDFTINNLPDIPITLIETTNSLIEDGYMEYNNYSFSPAVRDGYAGLGYWGGAGVTASVGCSNIIFRRLTVVGGWGEPLMFDKGAIGCIGEYCTLIDCWTPFYIQQSVECTIRNCIIFCNTTDDPGAASLLRGIALVNESDALSQYLPVRDCIIENNIIVGATASGINIGAQVSDISNCIIRNNTFVNCKNSFDIANATDCTFENNISLNPVNAHAILGTGNTGLLWQNNLWSSAPVANVNGANDVIGDPILVNPVTVVLPTIGDANNYKIATAASPAIDAGIQNGLSIDYFSGARPVGSAIDIGAHEYNSPVIVPPDNCPGLITNGSFSTGDFSGWQVYTDGVANADASSTVMVYSIIDGGTNTQLNQHNIPLINGTEYTLSFLASSDVASSIDVQIIKNLPPYSSLGLIDTINTTTVPQVYTFQFTATSDYADSRVMLKFNGLNNVVFSLDDFCLVPTTGAPGTITAAFSASPNTTSTGETVTFINNSTSTNGISSYLWDFGDGNTSTLSNPTHSWSLANTYTVSLTVTGPDGTNTATTTITVFASLDPLPATASEFIMDSNGTVTQISRHPSWVDLFTSLGQNYGGEVLVSYNIFSGYGQGIDICSGNILQFNIDTGAYRIVTYNGTVIIDNVSDTRLAEYGLKHYIEATSGVGYRGSNYWNWYQNLQYALYGNAASAWPLLLDNQVITANSL